MIRWIDFITLFSSQKTSSFLTKCSFFKSLIRSPAKTAEPKKQTEDGAAVASQRPSEKFSTRRSLPPSDGRLLGGRPVQREEAAAGVAGVLRRGGRPRREPCPRQASHRRLQEASFCFAVGHGRSPQQQPPSPHGPLGWPGQSGCLVPRERSGLPIFSEMLLKVLLLIAIQAYNEPHSF